MMSRSHFLRSGLFCAFLFPIAVCSQETTAIVQRDREAVEVVSKTLTALGGVNAIAGTKDFVASGSVVYNWEDSTVEGSVTLKGRASGELRIDARLSDGMHSWVTRDGAAEERHSDGIVTSLPVPTTSSSRANSTLPMFLVLSALQDRSWSISSVHGVEFDGQHAFGIVLHKIYLDSSDPAGAKSKATETELIVDPSTFFVLSIRDRAYRKDGSPGDAPHEIRFSDYKSFDGILVPTTITELIGDQQTDRIQLNHVTFNEGLADSEFALD